MLLYTRFEKDIYMQVTSLMSIFVCLQKCGFILLFHHKWKFFEDFFLIMSQKSIWETFGHFGTNFSFPYMKLLLIPNIFKKDTHTLKHDPKEIMSMR